MWTVFELVFANRPSICARIDIGASPNTSYTIVDTHIAGELGSWSIMNNGDLAISLFVPRDSAGDSGESDDPSGIW
jgi:hypothetical protein